MRLFRSIIPLFAVILAASCAAATNVSNDSSGGSGNTGSVNPVYVSAAGNDANTGLSADSPLLTMQTAIDLAKNTNSTALFISGDFLLTNTTNGCGVVFSGITNNLLVSGGWNTNFTVQSNESLLNGGQIATRVVFMES